MASPLVVNTGGKTVRRFLLPQDFGSGGSGGQVIATNPAGGGVSWAGGMVQIQRIVLQSAGLIDFTSIPNNFNVLRVYLTVLAASGAAQGMDMRVNNMSSSAYFYQTLIEGNGTVSGEANNADGQTQFRYGVGDSTNPYAGIFEIWNCKYDVQVGALLATRAGVHCVGTYTANDVRRAVGYASINAYVSRLTFGATNVGNLAVGSHATLYGIS